MWKIISKSAIYVCLFAFAYVFLCMPGTKARAEESPQEYQYDENLFVNGTLTISSDEVMIKNPLANEMLGIQRADVKEVVFADGVTFIAPNAFKDCINLTKISIPSSVIQIGEYAFASSGLTEVTLPASTVTICEGAFAECSRLKYAILGSNVDSIGSNAFPSSTVKYVNKGSISAETLSKEKCGNVIAHSGIIHVFTENSCVAENIVKGQPSKIKGKIYASAGIKSITVKFKNNKGKSVPSAVTVTYSGFPTACFLESGEVDAKARFDLLPTGNTTVIISVTDRNSQTKEFSYNFIVDDEVKVENLPAEYIVCRKNTLGAAIFPLNGKITANSAITSVSASLYQNGKEHAKVEYIGGGKKDFDLSELIINAPEWSAEGWFTSGEFNLDIIVATEKTPEGVTFASKVKIVAAKNFVKKTEDIYAKNPKKPDDGSKKTSISNTTKDITLNKVTVDNCTIYWKSDNTSVVSNTGKIKSKGSANLLGYFTRDKITYVRSIPITVKETDKSTPKKTNNNASIKWSEVFGEKYNPDEEYDTPTVICGSGFRLKGKLISNNDSVIIAKVTGKILSGKTVKYEETVEVNKSEFSLANSNIDKALEFGKLPEGTYTIIIEATDSKGEVVELKNEKFKVISLTQDISQNMKDSGAGISVLKGNKDFSWPVKTTEDKDTGYLQSCFIDWAGHGGQHKAIDISTGGERVNVCAAYDGVVVMVDPSFNAETDDLPLSDPRKTKKDGFGNNIVIKHSYVLNTGETVTLYTRYSHLARKSICVKVGDLVKAGDKIAITGTTGSSSGVHLDFQILYGDYTPYKLRSLDPFVNELLEIPDPWGIQCKGWTDCCGYYLEVIKEHYPEKENLLKDLIKRE